MVLWVGAFAVVAALVDVAAAAVVATGAHQSFQCPYKGWNVCRTKHIFTIVFGKFIYKIIPGDEETNSYYTHKTGQPT